VRLIGQAIAVNGQVPGYHFHLGLALHDLGQINGAAASFRRAIGLNPGFFEAHNNLGKILQDKGRLAEAEAAYAEALRIFPSNAEIHRNRANVLRDLGRLEDAEAGFRQAITLKADFAEAHNGLGDILRRLGRPQEAEASIRRAIELKTDLAEAWSNLGILVRDQDRLSEAGQILIRAATLDPHSAEIHCNLGIVFRDLSQFGDAEICFRQAVALKPGYAEAHSSLGNVLRELERLPEAEECLRRAIEIRPTFAPAHRDLGCVLDVLGRRDEAIYHLEAAVACDPQLADAHAILGSLQMLDGRVEAGVASELEALRLVSDLSLAWKMLGWGRKARDRLRGADGSGRFEDTEIPTLARATPIFVRHKLDLACYSPETVTGGVLDAALAALPVDEPLPVGAASPGRAAGAAGAALADSVVALLHFGRSGTGLMHSLIDSHPQISTIPSIYLQGFFEDGVWRRLGGRGWRHLPDRFAEIFEVVFDARSQRPVPSPSPDVNNIALGWKEGMANVGDNRDEWLSVDRERFRAETLRLMEGMETVDQATFFKVVHAAFDLCTGAAAPKGTIFYHLHYRSLAFQKRFPDARFVMMVREPLQSCESWIRLEFDEGGYVKVVPRIARMLFDVDRPEGWRHDVVGVRLEDLKARSGQTLRALCAWMGVDEAPSLYQMTAQGKKWWGDPSSPDYSGAKAMDPFDRTCLSRKPVGIFSEKDRFILGTLFHPFSVRFGYREDDAEGFRRDLARVRPLLDEMMDFERVCCEREGGDPARFRRRGDYLFFHAAIEDRWRTLDRLGTYPNMVKPLVLAD